MGLLNDYIKISNYVKKRKGRKYFMFRNTGRLKKFKRTNALFEFLKIIAGIVVAASAVALMVWLFTAMFTLGNAPQSANDWATLGVIGLAVGVGVLLITITISYFVEGSFAKAEKKELEQESDEGAQKYLKVIVAHRKVRKTNLIFALISLLVPAVILVISLSEATVIAAVVVFGVASIISKIMAMRGYSKVKAEISEIKTERKQNKKLAKK